MRFFVAGVLACAVATASASSPALSAPVVVPSVESGITLIDGGCGGPQFYRAPNGYCYRKPGSYYAPRPPPPPAYYAPRPPPPPGYYGRACAPGFHPTPYGCRPNY